MDRSPFDFDVVTGPALSRPPPPRKDAPAWNDDGKPSGTAVPAAPPASGQEPAVPG